MPKNVEDDIILFNSLISKIKSYHPAKNLNIVNKAYELAKGAHLDQKRKSGQPYIIHPLEVAHILAGLELDLESIVSGILHDVIEDTPYTYSDLKQLFSQEIADIVEGVTKLDKFIYSSKEELQAENYRKMFLAMAKDIRVILIKVADRLHNMRTLQYMRDDKQREIAQETLDIYAPIATRLGIFKIKTELEDLSLRYLKKDIYYDLAKKIERRIDERELYVKKIVDELNFRLKSASIDAKIYGRPKHFYSIYNKMTSQDKDLDQIFDLIAVRIIVDDIRFCYEVLGIVHEAYKPIAGRFKDYIAMPKENMYQSLHTTLVGPEGLPFEIQIRTWEMHKIAEYGIAAHWKYKGGRTSNDAEEEKLNWLRQILEWQNDMRDSKEFIASIKSNLNAFSDNVYCFTPKGDVKSLPVGSTPIDFAYYIHSAVGNKMIGSKVNGKIVTFDYILKNGDRVEILTSQNSKGPSLDWLKIVRSPQAKTKISQWFKNINKEDNILKGKDLLEKEAKRKGYNFNEIATPNKTIAVANKYNFKEWNSICAAVGHGGIKEGQIINFLIELFNSELNKNKSIDEIITITTDKINSKYKNNISKSSKNSSVIVENGVDGLDIRFSKCCSAVPGDEIIGFITRGRGISVHRTDCLNIIKLSEDKRKMLVDVFWNYNLHNKNNEFDTHILIFAQDRFGILGDITKVFTEEKVSIKSINCKTQNNTFIASAIILINNISHLEFLYKKIKNIKGVYCIKRATS